MNATLKTILLTVLTLSVLTIAMIELSGISRTALFNKLEGNKFITSSVAGDRPSTSDTNLDIPSTTIEFESDVHDFGEVKDGTVVEHIFTFVNTGQHPLMIDEVVATCGCTVPTYTRTPVAPGESGMVAISFNSKGRVGNVDKAVLLKSNAQKPVIPLTFKAIVTP